MLKPLNILNGTIPYSTRVNVSFIAGFTTEPIWTILSIGINLEYKGNKFDPQKSEF